MARSNSMRQCTWLCSSGLLPQGEVERVVPRLQVHEKRGLGVVRGRQSLHVIVGGEAGITRLAFFLARGRLVPDDFDAMLAGAEARPFGHGQGVLSALDRGMSTGTFRRLSVGQEENAAAVDGLSIEGDTAMDIDALAAS